MPMTHRSTVYRGGSISGSEQGRGFHASTTVAADSNSRIVCPNPAKNALASSIVISWIHRLQRTLLLVGINAP
jgi:hypothetical protein